MHLVHCINVIVLSFALASGQFTTDELPSNLLIDESSVSVSGLSAGGFMAVQMHVAFSDLFIGAGVFAGGPYWCAKGQLFTATGACMASPNQINVNTLFQQTEAAASSGKIDPLENLQNDRVYLFSGKSDTTVKPGVMTAAEDYYNKYVNANNIKTEFSTNAEHGFPTVYYGGTCSRQNPQQHYINKCDFDGAYEALNHIHGNLQKPSYPANTEGTLMKFDQKEFFDSSGGFLSSYSGLEDVGYLYVPKSCKDGNKVCKLHLSLHGCKQSSEVANEDYVTQTGYIEVADLNDFIILSPQAKSDMVSNPNGCFDWWGYAGADYAYQSGIQMAAIKSMIDKLMTNSGGNVPPPSTSTAVPPTSAVISPTTSDTTTDLPPTVPGDSTLRIDPNSISVSGLSAGGYMAVQMHVAHSEVFMGVGVLAGGPYMCAGNNLFTATGACMEYPNQIDVADLQQMTRDRAYAGSIDAVENMQNDRVFLYSGDVDTVVRQGVVQAAEDYYKEFVNEENIKTEYSIQAQNGFPTMDYGGECDRQNTLQHKILKCNYDGAYQVLSHIYGDLQQANYPVNSIDGTLTTFDQTEFFASGGIFSSYNGLDDEGYLFVPNSCKNGNKACKLHVVFHGCQQSAQVADEDFVTHAGYNEVAALNDVIVLYPQAKLDFVSNPNGCFDWWGYTDANYATNQGIQVVAVMSMVEKLVNGA